VNLADLGGEGQAVLMRQGGYNRRVLPRQYCQIALMYLYFLFVTSILLI